MISSIDGILSGKYESSVVIEVGGFGIEVFLPGRAIAAIGDEGERVRLFTWLHVREDALTLFGFTTETDRKTFLSLISVSGVGPKLALGILSVQDGAEITRAIHHEDTATLVSLPGIGKKTAERMILELRDKIDISVLESVERERPGTRGMQLFEEAVAALVSIGLTRANARKAVENIGPAFLSEDPSVEEIVREALRNAAPI